MRAALVLVHRYAGLVMAGFLLVAGLTGSLLAWNDEIEAALLPALFTATPPSADAVPMDPLRLHEQLAQQRPEAVVSYVPLMVRSGQALRFMMAPRPAADGSPGAPLANDQVFIDPYTGAVLGERKYGDIGQGLKNLMPFVYRLHYSLALGTVGEYLFGVIALLWTIDCFVGAWLTFPARVANRHRQPWLKRWWKAWLVRRGSGAYKLNFDLHRAGGLWPWAMLLVLAWSSVAFNLSEVYTPVMRLFLAHQPDDESAPMLSPPRSQPRLDWPQARDHGRRLMALQAHAHGFGIRGEDSLAYDPGHGLYRYDVLSDRDIRDHSGSTSVYFDGDSGDLKAVWLPTGAAGADTVRMWITSLHMAALWGWPLKLFICLMGLAVAMLSATGLVIWWKKRSARRMRRH